MVPGPVRSLPLKTLRLDPRRSKVMGSSYSSTRPSVNVIRKRVLLATRGVWHEGGPERCCHRRAVELQAVVVGPREAAREVHRPLIGLIFGYRPAEPWDRRSDCCLEAVSSRCFGLRLRDMHTIRAPIEPNPRRIRVTQQMNNTTTPVTRQPWSRI